MNLLGIFDPTAKVVHSSTMVNDAPVTKAAPNAVAYLSTTSETMAPSIHPWLIVLFWVALVLAALVVVPRFFGYRLTVVKN
jgi:hypothetical protein